MLVRWSRTILAYWWKRLNRIAKRSLSIGEDTHRKIAIASAQTGRDMYELIADAWALYERNYPQVGGSTEYPQNRENKGLEYQMLTGVLSPIVPVDPPLSATELEAPDLQEAVGLLVEIWRTGDLDSKTWITGDLKVFARDARHIQGLIHGHSGSDGAGEPNDDNQKAVVAALERKGIDTSEITGSQVRGEGTGTDTRHVVPLEKRPNQSNRSGRKHRG